MSNRRSRQKNKVKSGTKRRKSSPNQGSYQAGTTPNKRNPYSQASAGMRMRQGFQNTFVWIDREPRQSAFLNIGAYLLQGLLLGLAMGLIASLGTGGLPKEWTYMANTLAVLLFRLILQWTWALPVTELVHNMTRWFVKVKTGRDVPEKAIRQTPITNNVSTITGPTIVALALATILSTEDIEPVWLNHTWAVIVVSALGGGIASAIEALGLPSNIYAIRRNRHSYQDNPNFLHGKGQRRRNRNQR